MTAEIISVGTELLLGNILNTNAQYLSRELAALGITVRRQSTIGDNHGRLAEFVNEAKQRCDLLVFTGGLGPTADDLTKETVAACFGDTLTFDPEEWQKIVDFFTRTGRETTPNNRKQAMVPVHGHKVVNHHGTAPGAWFEQDGHCAVLMPGVPHEMKAMWEESVRPLLLEKIYQDRQINSLQYTDLNGHTLTIGQDVPDPGARRQTALEMALNATPGGFVIQTSDSADFPYILCGRRILRSQDMSLKKLGTIVVALDVGKLLDNEIHSLSSRPSELYLYNGTQLIYHSGAGKAAVLPPEESAHGYQISTIGGNKYYICWLTSPLTGLRLCSVFDYHQIYGQINTARNALIFGECAILLLFAWVLLHMARLVTKPIHTLSEAMQTVD